MTMKLVTEDDVMVCRYCGCTDDMPCIDEDGYPCSWYDNGCCTACAETPIDELDSIWEDQPIDELLDTVVKRINRTFTAVLAILEARHKLYGDEGKEDE